MLRFLLLAYTVLSLLAAFCIYRSARRDYERLPDMASPPPPPSTDDMVLLVGGFIDLTHDPYCVLEDVALEYEIVSELLLRTGRDDLIDYVHESIVARWGEDAITEIYQNMLNRRSS